MQGATDVFCELSLLGLVLSGYLALLGSGALTVSMAVLVASGLILLVSFTAVTKRGYWSLKVLAFMELLSAAILSTNLNFLPLLALFLVFGVATFAGFEIRRRTCEPFRIWRGYRTGFHLRLATFSLLVATGIFLLTAGLFFLLPRTADAASQRLASSRYRIPGFSGELRLGEIRNILHRRAPVMHVRFREPVQYSTLYWRGAILSRFDGTRWTAATETACILPVHDGRLILGTDEQRRRVGLRLTYEVRLKFVGSDGLFFTGIPEVLWIDSPSIMRTPAGTYKLGYRTTDGLRYGAVSYFGSSETSSDEMPEALQENLTEYLQLPRLDPRVVALARSVVRDASSAVEQAQAIETFLRHSYSYSIEPPARPPADPLAWFLFERRRGHCEYFASAMAVMLRTLGIPSRVITGFRGGQLNPVSGWYVIRASDAHSWVQAWFPLQGWIAFDPTPLITPPSAPISLWDKARWYLDAADIFWQDWVVNYDFRRQLALAVHMEDSGRGLRTLWLERVVLTGAQWKALAWEWLSHNGLLWASLILAAGSLWIFWPRLWRLWTVRTRFRKALSGSGQAADATILYGRALELLKRKGFEKPAWMTPGEFALLIRQPELALLVRDLTAAYHEVRYQGNPATMARLAALLRQLERTL